MGNSGSQAPPGASGIDYSKAIDGTAVIHDDPWLEPYASVLRDRFATFQYWKSDITHKEGSLSKFAEGYKEFGFQVGPEGIRYKEWAPGAKEMYLYGEFNNWNQWSHGLTAKEYGVWEIFLPNNPDGSLAIPHASEVKLAIRTQSGEIIERISPWIRYAVQKPPDPNMKGIFWHPPGEWTYQWKHPKPPKPDRLRIYEAHVGMASEHHRIGTYKEFEEKVLPHVAYLGYNCIQLMAVMEHSYYASFGYQVTSFFAAASRSGTPEDLKSLIDKAHSMGIVVLLDLVHSHASKNTADGLNMFDGTDACYFHSGSKGTHPMWDSRLFDYTSWEVLRFLLSNLRFWIDIYKFDGFRFDGVTAMLLHNRSVGDLPNSYDQYFGSWIDGDGLRYLTLANDMLHETYPDIITISEDATGFACLCRPTSEGGVGFDYRLAMGLPDKWKKLMETPDQDWNMGSICHELSNRRFKEATVAYVESHDQALVGDKTIAFRLMDKAMYTHMSVLSEYIPIVDRGIQLHKMIRLITFALGGEAYLTFMGNEFGHPEWIDFPREGNGWSFHHCCRRWYLMRDQLLRYPHLLAFEKAMVDQELVHEWLNTKSLYIGLKHEDDKVISFEKNGLVFIFNFHPEKSFTDYPIPTDIAGTYGIILNSDEDKFGGHSRVDSTSKYLTKRRWCHGRRHTLSVYTPSRTALILQRISDETQLDDPEPEPEPVVETKTEPKAKAEVKADAKGKTESVVAPKAKTEDKVDPKGKTEVKADPKGKTEAKAQVVIPPKAELKQVEKPKASKEAAPTIEQKQSEKAKATPKPKGDVFTF